MRKDEHSCCSSDDKRSSETALARLSGVADRELAAAHACDSCMGSSAYEVCVQRVMVSVVWARGCRHAWGEVCQQRH